MDKETLNKLEAFNRRVEEAKKSTDDTSQPGALNAVTAEQQVLLQAEDSSLSNADRIAKKALQTQQEVDRVAREEEQRAKEQEQQQNNAVQKAQRAVGNAASGALDSIETPVRWLERAPTLTGLGIIVALIALFILAALPVDQSGNTRLKLIWLTLTGKTHLSYQDSSSGGGQSSSFNQNGNTQIPLSQQVQAQSVPIEIPDLSGIDFTGL